MYYCNYIRVAEGERRRFSAVARWAAADRLSTIISADSTDSGCTATAQSATVGKWVCRGIEQ